MTAAPTVHLGFMLGSGNPVAVPLAHLAVTGQTQASGKTTTLEALVARSGRTAIAFKTKRHEASFAHAVTVPPYFRERADWQFVSAVLEATFREKMRFERAWIMRACKGAKRLAEVRTNVRALMRDAKGLSADIYMTLDHYLDVVVPQIGALDAGAPMALAEGLNVMDLTAFTTELQALVIRSTVEWVHYAARDTLLIIPEAWEFIPQNRGSPVLLACEQLVRKGAAGGNYVWLDSQDIAAVHKNVLRSVGVWILGVQREANEVKRALAHIPGKKPKIDDVMQLERGQFLVCYGSTVVKVYVQPAWLDQQAARDIAMGRVRLAPPPQWEDDTVNEKEAQALREANARLESDNDALRNRIAHLERRIEEAARQQRSPELIDGGYMRVPSASESPKPIVEPAPNVAVHEIADQVYELVVQRAQADPKMLALLKQVPEIAVTVERRVIEATDRTLFGRLACLIADGFFAEPKAGYAAYVELQRRGQNNSKPNVYKELAKLAELGFLTKEDDGYRTVPSMTVRIVEAAA